MVNGPEVFADEPRFTLLKAVEAEPVIEALSPVELASGATFKLLAVTMPPVMLNEIPVAPLPTWIVLPELPKVPPEIVRLPP